MEIIRDPGVKSDVVCGSTAPGHPASSCADAALCGLRYRFTRICTPSRIAGERFFTCGTRPPGDQTAWTAPLPCLSRQLADRLVLLAVHGCGWAAARLRASARHTSDSTRPLLSTAHPCCAGGWSRRRRCWLPQAAAAGFEPAARAA